MRRSLCSAPEDFVSSPMLALIPQRGNVNKLSQLIPSLHARFETVNSMRTELEDASDKNISKKVVAEEAMLKQVLEYLGVKIDK